MYINGFNKTPKSAMEQFDSVILTVNATKIEQQMITLQAMGLNEVQAVMTL